MNAVSSTHIRKAIRANLSIKYLTPDAVVDYIEQNHLWNDPAE